MQTLLKLLVARHSIYSLIHKPDGFFPFPRHGIYVSALRGKGGGEGSVPESDVSEAGLDVQYHLALVVSLRVA